MPAFLNNFRFEDPRWFWLLLLLPVLAVLRGAFGHHPTVQFSSLHLLKKIARPGRSAAGMFALLASLLTFALTVVALARPQTTRVEEKVEDSGVEIMMVMDVSLSMAIEDFFIGGEKVNRLTMAKNMTRSFVQGRKSDRIGLVAFAGRPYLACHLTLDHAWFIREMENRVAFNLPDMEDGTAIGSAIVTAALRLDKRDAKSKIMVLITDGASNSGNYTPTGAAERAKELGIKIYAIAIGTPGRHTIPVPNRQGMHAGIRQEFDEETLKKVADATNGKFYKAQDSTALAGIFSEIDRLEKNEPKIQRKTHATDLYPQTIAIAMSWAVLSTLLYHTVFRRYPS